MSLPHPVSSPRIALFAIATWLSLLLPMFATGPVMFGTLPARTVFSGSEQLDLNTVFQAADAPGTVVQLTVVMSGTGLVSGTSTINLALSDSAAPVTVANFLSYVRAGNYNNSFFHRSFDTTGSSSMQIVQGGGFRITDGTSNLTGTTLGVVPQRTEIINEYDPSRPNKAGTIAMARLSGSNTASNEWFINVADNSSVLGASNTGGYAVFGNVIGSGTAASSGTAVASNIFALPISDLAGRLGNNLDAALTEVPLSEPFPGSAAITTIPRSDVVTVQSANVIPALTYSASSSNPSIVVVSNTAANNLLSLSYVGPGTATVTVTATDVEGNVTSSSFPVVVKPSTASLVAFASANMSVSGTCGTAVVHVVRTGVTSGSFTVQYYTGDGTAVGGTTSGAGAFKETSGILSFAAGVTDQIINIPITKRIVPAPGKWFNVHLFGSINNVPIGTISDAVVTISDTVGGVLQLSSTSYSADQTAGSLRVEVSRTGGSTGAVSAVISTQDGTALTGTDYTGLTQLVTFADGDTAPKTVSIPLVGGTNGQTKNFTISLTLVPPAAGAVLGANTFATVTLFEGWEVEIPSPNYTVTSSTSGTTAVITVQRSGTDEISVPFTTGTGTAVAGTDYTATIGTVAFPAGITTQEIDIPILGGTSGLGGTFTVSLTGSVTTVMSGSTTPVNTLIAPAFQTTTVTIEPASSSTNGVIVLSSTSYRFDTSSTNINAVTVNRSGATGTATAFVELDDPSGTFGHDYFVYDSNGTLCSSPVVEIDFGTGVSSQVFYVRAASGSGPKILTATIVSTSPGIIGTPGSAQITFVDSQSADGLVEFAQTAYSVNASNGMAFVTVTRGPLTAGTVTVAYTDGGGTAKAGRDYVSGSNTLTFQPGETYHDIAIPLRPGAVEGGNFLVTLSSTDSNTMIGANNVATVTIAKVTVGKGSVVNPVRFSQRSYEFDSSNTSAIGVAILNPAKVSGTAYVEMIDVTGTLGQNYSAATASGYFAADNGSFARVVPVILGTSSNISYLYLQGSVIGTQSLSLRIVGVAGSNCVIGTPATATVTFLDSNDPNGLVEFSQSTYDADESSGWAEVAVQRTGTVGEVAFQCAPVNGTAKNGVDFSFVPGSSFVFPAGVNIVYVPVKLLRNMSPKPPIRSFTMKLTGVDPNSGAILGAQNQSAKVVVVGQNDPNGVFEFGVPSYFASEDSGWVKLEVLRSGGTAGAADVNVVTADNFGDHTRGLLYRWFGQSSSAISGTVSTEHFLTAHFEPGQNRQELFVPLIAGGATSGTNLTSSSTTQAVYPFYAELYSTNIGVVGVQSVVPVYDFASENLATPSVEFDSTRYRVDATGTSISIQANLHYATATSASVLVPFEITSNSADLRAKLGSDYWPISGENVILSGTTPIMDGTAVVATTVSGTLRFPPGATSTVLSCTIPAGTGSVPEKRFSVQLNSPVTSGTVTVGTLLGQTTTTVTIVDPSATGKGMFEFEQPTYSFYENCGSFTANVVRSGSARQLAQPVAVRVETEDGSAAGGQYDLKDSFAGYQNYISKTQILHFAANEKQKSFTVPVVNNSLGSETSANLRVRIVSVDAGAQIGAQDAPIVTLLNPAAGTAPTLNFDQFSYDVDETGSNFYITVDRVNGSGTTNASYPLTVPYTISDGSAKAGTDYALISGSSAIVSGTASISGTTVTTTGTLTFPSNATSAQIPVKITSHSKTGLAFSVQLISGSATLNGGITGVGVVGPNPVMVTIHPAGLFEFSPTSYSVDQTGGQVALWIVRTGIAPATVQFQTQDGTAAAGTDYDFRSFYVNFAAGETRRYVTVPIIGTASQTRSFLAQLLPTAAGAVGALTTATVSIEPNLASSGSTPVEFGQGAYDVYDTGTLFASVNLYASGGVAQSIPYEIIPKSARSGANFGPGYSYSTTGTGGLILASGSWVKKIATVTSSTTVDVVTTGTSGGVVVKSTSNSFTAGAPLAIGAMLSAGGAVTSGTLTLPVGGGTAATLAIPMIHNPSAGPLSPDRYFLLQLGNPGGSGTAAPVPVPVMIHATNNPNGVIEFPARSGTITLRQGIPLAIPIKITRLGGTTGIVNVILKADSTHGLATFGSGPVGTTQAEFSFADGQREIVVKFTPDYGTTSVDLVLEQPSDSYGATVTTWAQRARMTLKTQ